MNMMEQKVIAVSGDEAVAYAAKQCKPDVVAAYPITPQTIIVERFSEYVANGEVDSEFICVESEHSALSACIGASLAGARVFTATSSQGLALMHEMLYIASGLRCPIVMAIVNRALSAPINIHGDHSDIMGSRDSGWIDIFCENSQEAYDFTIQAFKLSEDHDILLPVSVNLDGFILSHSVENIKALSDDYVSKFLPERVPYYTLNAERPITIGALALPDYYFEIKRQQDEAYKKVLSKFKEISKEFSKFSGRKYDVIDIFQIDDAKIALIGMGSTIGTAKYVAKQLRKKGKKVGVIGIKVYRPFPSKEIIKALENLKALAILDRALSPGALSAPLGLDIKALLYEYDFKIPVINFVYGLGGRDISPKEIVTIFNRTEKIAKEKTMPHGYEYIGVREK